LSKIAVAVSIFGGGLVSPEVTSRLIFAVTGAKPCLGSLVGEMLPPNIWVGGTPIATPATTSAAIEPRTRLATARRLRFLFIPISSRSDEARAAALLSGPPTRLGGGDEKTQVFLLR
jgi:hypothetical protein